MASSLLSCPLVGLVLEALADLAPLGLRLLPQVQVHLGLALHLLQLVPNLKAKKVFRGYFRSASRIIKSQNLTTKCGGKGFVDSKLKFLIQYRKFDCKTE